MESTGLGLAKHFCIADQLADRFWKIWIREYLPTLTRRTNGFNRAQIKFPWMTLFLLLMKQASKTPVQTESRWWLITKVFLSSIIKRFSSWLPYDQPGNV